MPRLSVVVLTRNEEANVEEAVRSVLASGDDVEVVVVDSASRDGTVAIARRLATELGEERVRVLACEVDLPIGEARNLGVEAARADRVAFLSADAVAAPGWAEAVVRALDGADVVYGRQEHAPPRLTVGAILRGLRYHHFADDGRAPPETYASNVNAGVRREVFDRVGYVDEGPASALDDVLFTVEAKRLGHRIAYEPRMLVRHKDAATLRQELVKNRREGYGWGILARQVGLHRLVLAWGALLALALAALALVPSGVTLAGLLLALYAPTLRRAARGGAPYVRAAPGSFVAATLLGPAFDTAFLLAYARGLIARRPDLTGVRRPHGV